MSGEYQQGGQQAPEVAATEAKNEMAVLTGPNGAAAGANPDNAQNAFFDGLAANAVSPVAAAVVSGLDATNNSGAPSQQESRYLGENQKPKHRIHMPTPLVPMSYGEMKTAAKKAAKWGGQKVRSGSVFIGDRYKSLTERMGITSQSLTGGGTADGEKAHTKGLKVKEAAVQKLAWLKKKLDAAEWAKKGLNRYENNTARLEVDTPNSRFARKALKNPNVRPAAVKAPSAAPA